MHSLSSSGSLTPVPKFRCSTAIENDLSLIDFIYRVMSLSFLYFSLFIIFVLKLINLLSILFLFECDL